MSSRSTAFNAVYLDFGDAFLALTLEFAYIEYIMILKSRFHCVIFVNNAKSERSIHCFIRILFERR